MEILGTRNISEAKVIKALRLKRRIDRKILSRKVAKKIRNYYRKNGYKYVKVYIMQNDDDMLKLYVDEGVIGKILILNVNDFDLLRVKIKFKLKNNTYNIKEIEKNTKMLKENLGFKQVYYKLLKIKDYSDSTFQLDRMMFGKNKLPFFDEYGPRYDLELYLSRQPLPQDGKMGDISKKYNKKNGFGFKFKIDFNSGFVPILTYYKHDLIQKRDFFKVSSSLGIMYGLNGVFDEPPSVTFFSTNAEYHLKPVFKGYFSPRFRTSIYWTNSSREELGLLSYEFFKFNFEFSPGIVVSKFIRIYLTFGEDIIAFLNSKSDHDPANQNKYPGKEYPLDINKRTDYFTYLGPEFVFAMIPIRLGSPMKRDLSFFYYFYMPEKKLEERMFHKVGFAANFDTEIVSRSIFSLLVKYGFLWEEPPFHQHFPVSSSAFKGLGGYYTKHILSVSNEYRASIYRDYIYIGLFTDMTLFEGLGYQLAGVHYGFVIGPTLRFLVLDQLEFYFHYGIGYLVTNKYLFHGYNFGFHRKW